MRLASLIILAPRPCSHARRGGTGDLATRGGAGYEARMAPCRKLEGATAKVPLDSTAPRPTIECSRALPPSSRAADRLALLIQADRAGGRQFVRATRGQGSTRRRRFDVSASNPRCGCEPPGDDCDADPEQSASKRSRSCARRPRPGGARRTDAEVHACCAERSGELLAHMSSADMARLDLLRAAVGDDNSPTSAALRTLVGATYESCTGASELSAHVRDDADVWVNHRSRNAREAAALEQGSTGSSPLAATRTGAGSAATIQRTPSTSCRAARHRDVPAPGAADRGTRRRRLRLAAMYQMLSRGLAGFAAAIARRKAGDGSAFVTAHGCVRAHCLGLLRPGRQLGDAANDQRYRRDRAVPHAAALREPVPAPYLQSGYSGSRGAEALRSGERSSRSPTLGRRRPRRRRKDVRSGDSFAWSRRLVAISATRGC